jgi:hypothetical protein
MLFPEHVPTPQEFIETWPLYTRAEIQDFEPPSSITRMCRRCTKETTWSCLNADSVDVSNVDPSRTFRYAAYACVLCQKDSVLVVYQKLDWKQRPQSANYSYYAVKKIGQEPAQSVEIPADLSKRLGTTAEHYRKALISRNTNFGIGAVAYMRRVVEEKTDELIDVVVELARTYHVDENILTSLAKAKEQIRYEEKLKVASEVIPDVLRPGGVNPLGQLYEHLSIGVHDKADDECVLIFDDLKADFEYVFRNLYVQAREAREFAQRVKERARKKA